MRLLQFTRNDVTFEKCFYQKVERKIRLTGSIVGRMFKEMILGLLENWRMYFDIALACECSSGKASETVLGRRERASVRSTGWFCSKVVIGSIKHKTRG